MGSGYYLGNGEAGATKDILQRMIFRTILTIALLLALVCASAQRECSQRYDDAKALYDDGDRRACIATIDSTLADCRKDRDLACRLLFLKSLAEAGEDSLERMRSDLEQLFRTDRRYTIKAYDPLMKGKKGEAELYNAWEQLHDHLRKDLGRWRAGVHFSVLFPMPRATTDFLVLETDGPLTYSAHPGWETGVNTEWDIIPNLCFRAAFGSAELGFIARNRFTQYEEFMSRAAVDVGIKKMFWLRDGTWVPSVSLNASFSWLRSDRAEIARNESDQSRFLGALSVDRFSERRIQQCIAGPSIGVSRKIGSTILNFETTYYRAFTQITTDSAPYTNTTLLTDFNYADNHLFLDIFSLRLTGQYVLDYHRKNRIQQ